MLDMREHLIGVGLIGLCGMWVGYSLAMRVIKLYFDMI